MKKCAKKWKSLLALVLALALTVSAVPLETAAAEVSSGGEKLGETGTETMQLEPDSEIAKEPESAGEESGETAPLELTETLTGTCGSNLTWELTTDGVLTIRGTGEMWTRDVNGWWPTYEVKKVVLEDGVTSIGREAFAYQYYLEDVTIPDSVTHIGREAFLHCGMKNIELPDSIVNIGSGAFRGCRLERIVIPESMTSIGSEVFSDCSSLTEVTIPASISSIGLNAFSGGLGSDMSRNVYITDLSNWCGIDFYSYWSNPLGAYPSNLYVNGELAENIIIPDGVEQIKDTAFSGCNSLVTVEVPGSVKEIGDTAFSGCSNLKSIMLSEGLERIGEQAFWCCDNLTDIALPAGITAVEKETFWGCDNLEHVSLPEGLISIGEGAFEGNAMREVALPDSLERIEDSAFSGCEHLTDIALPDGITQIGKSVFNGCRSLKQVQLPEHITSIGEWAFGGCANLTGILLPDSVTEIGKWAFVGSGLENITIPGSVTSWGDEAFRWCEKLESVTFTEGVENTGTNTFSDCPALRSVTLPASMKHIGDRTFSGCTRLEEIVLPEGLESIGGNAFSGSGLKAIVVPGNVKEMELAFNGCEKLADVTMREGITRIGDYAFSSCSSLTSITLPGSVTDIGNSAFSGSGLTSITLQERLTGIGDSAFSFCSSLTSITLPGSVTDIENNAFSGSGLTSIILPEGITRIAEGVFGDCESLKDIAISESVTIIGDSAFSSCVNLTSITLPECVVSIGKSAFAYSGMEQIRIPESVTSIGVGAFAGCENLTDITLPGGITTIETDTFHYCLSLKSITIPEGVVGIEGAFQGSGLKQISLPDSLKSIGDSAFSGCGLERVTIPDGVTNIGACAFSECKSLIDVDIPDGVSDIGASAFHWCSALETIKLPESLTTIGGDTFSYCKNLSSVNMGSQVSVIGNNAFDGCESLTDIDISDSVTGIGRHAFLGCASLGTLLIPSSVTSIREGAFDECGSDLLLLVEEDSYAKEYAAANDLPYSIYIPGSARLRVTVKAEDGSGISGGYTVRWYSADGDEAVGSGSTLYNVSAGTDYRYGILLGERLSCQYQNPEMGSITAKEGDAAVEVILHPIEQITIEGIIKDEKGDSVAGASLRLKQTFGNQYEKELTQMADEQGGFTISAANVDTLAVVSAEEYYDWVAKITPEMAENGKVLLNVVLKALPANRITMSFSERSAVISGETSYVHGINSAKGFNFALFNETKNRKIASHIVQYPYLILGEGEADAGDVIRISAEDERKQRTAEDVVVVLDEMKCGSADIEFVQNGSFRIRSVSGNEENMVLVFDDSDHLADSGSAWASYAGNPLPAGTYQAVLIKKTTLLRSLSRIDTLAAYGLVEGTDYINLPVTIANGEITVIDHVEVPKLEEQKLYYTIPENTYFMANRSTAVAGQYVTMRAGYEIDKKYTASEQTVQVELPEGMEFVSGSLTVNGKAAVCSQQENQVTVPVNNKSGTIRFYMLAAKAGQQTVHASLSFRNGQEAVAQPIGAAAVEVTAAKLQVPEQTGKKSVTVTGKALVNCDITVYDNGTAVGTTKSNKSGSWSLDFDLVSPYNYSYHTIYAAVSSKDYEAAIETERAGLIYNKEYIQPARVTMYNTDYLNREFVTVFDFLNPNTAVPTYDYTSGHPTFTFKAEFTGGDGESMPDVSVVTINANGDETYVKCAYDAKIDAWVGTHDYTSFSDVPCSVGVSYNGKSKIAKVQEMNSEEYEEYVEKLEELSETVTNELESLLDVGEIEENGGIIRIPFLSGSKEVAVFSAQLEDYETFSLDAWEEAGGYMEFEDEEGDLFYTRTVEEANGYTYYLAYPGDEMLLKQSVQLYDQTDAYQSRIIGIVEAGFLVRDILELTANSYICMNSINSNRDILKAKWKMIEKLFYMQGCQGRFMLQGEAREEVKEFLASTADQAEDYNRKGRYALAGAVVCNGVINLAAGRIAKKLQVGDVAENELLYLYFKNEKNIPYRLRNFTFEFLEVGSKETAEGGVGWITGKVLGLTELDPMMRTQNSQNEIFQDLCRQMDDMIDVIVEYARGKSCQSICGDTCACSSSCPVCKGKTDSSFGGTNDVSITQSVVPKADPSGYVYEAVPSNRVKGVKAEIYTYDYAVDEYGVPKEEKEEILWDAWNYDQINPQYTDDAGRFAWDVPKGQWLVKLSKEGYYSTDTRNDAAADEEGYLPVPPPQTEVNTAIVSKEAPAVERVSVYSDEVRIAFTQYMQMDTVTADQITVTCGGKQVRGTVAPVNAEDNYEKTKKYASVFVFTPDGSLAGSADVAVNGSKNYHGTSMEAVYEEELPVRMKPQSIQAPEAAQIDLHEEAQLKVQILPAKAGAGQTLTVVSCSPSIVSVSAETLQADENGETVIRLSSELPGHAAVRIVLEGTDLFAEIPVTSGKTENVTEAKISLENGDYQICLSQEAYIYDGTEKKPAVTVDGLTEGVDYTVSYSNAIHAGTASVTIRGNRKYTGTLTKTFTIGKANQTLKASASASVVKAGKTVQITAEGTGTVSYTSDNPTIASVDGKGVVKGLMPGNANITVNAAGDSDYNSAKAVLSFTVTGELSDCTVELSESAYTFDGKKKQPKVTVKYDKVLLTEGTEYTVDYYNHTNAGTASVVISGKGFYTGKLTKTFTIRKATQSITASGYTKTVSAKAQKFSIKAKSSGKGKLTFSSGNKSVKVDRKGKVTIAKNFIGEAVITIKADATANYNAVKKKIRIMVLPSKTKLSGVTSSGSRKIKVKWTKKAKVSGYEIQYSTSKKFAASATKTKKVKKASKTEYTISKLAKGKTYYVRIRTYKIVSGKKYYSNWSGKKKVKAR